jgi:hypothetical protein
MKANGSGEACGTQGRKQEEDLEDRDHFENICIDEG